MLLVTTRHSFAFIVLGLALAGCATPDVKPVMEPLIIQGKLSYAARIALPPDSRAIVELRDESTAAMPVVGEQRIELKAAQVPIPFKFAVDRTKLADGHRYALRGAVTTAGRATWVSDPMPIDASRPTVDVGTVMLKPHQALAFASVFYCGDTRVEVGFTDGAMRLLARNQAFDLRDVVTASGARYEAVNDSTTSFWNKGKRATLVIRGKEYSECFEGEPALPLRAHCRGHPLQRARGSDRDHRRIRGPLVPGFDERHAASLLGHRDDGGRGLAWLRRRARGPAARWRVGGRGPRRRGNHRPLAHDRAVRRQWQRVRPSLLQPLHRAIHAQQRRRHDSRPAVTLRACAPSLMAQEERFLTTLRAVRGFDISSDGALVLKADGKRSIKARRGG